MTQDIFNIKSVTWHEVTEKIKEEIIADALNNNMRLSKYGKGLESIFFIYLAVEPTNSIHQNESYL